MTTEEQLAEVRRLAEEGTSNGEDGAHNYLWQILKIVNPDAA